MLQKTSFRLHYPRMMLHNFLFIVHLPVSGDKTDVFTGFAEWLGEWNPVRPEPYRISCFHLLISGSFFLFHFVGCFPVVAGEVFADVTSGNTVAHALIGRLAGIVGIEEIGSVACEPAGVFVCVVGQTPDGKAGLLRSGHVLLLRLDYPAIDIRLFH